MTKNDLNYWRNKLKDVVSPENLITPEVVALRDQQNKMLNLMAKKNADYGNAFNKGCDAIGEAYGLCRMFDKANRFIKQAADRVSGYYNPNVTDESIYDTIEDLGNYCAMFLAWINTINGDGTHSIPSTGGLDKDSPKIELCQLISTNQVKLLSEIDGTDNTDEITIDYGITGLCKDNDNYVYTVSDSRSEIPVTNRKQENVVAVRTELVKNFKYNIEQGNGR